jgi:hypothetical protein
MVVDGKDILLTITAILLTSVSPVSAVNWEITQNLCPENLVLGLPEQTLPPIPVGCEVVDCCPGCPKPDVLDWRIRLEGDLVKSAVLKFSNLYASTSKNPSKSMGMPNLWVRTL